MKDIQFPKAGGPSNVSPQSNVKTKGPKRTPIPNFNFRQALNELSKSLVYSKPPVISKYNDEIQKLTTNYEGVPSTCQKPPSKEKVEGYIDNLRNEGYNDIDARSDKELGKYMAEV